MTKDFTIHPNKGVKVLLIFIFIFLVGCKDNENINDRKCSAEQYKIVENRYKLCVDSGFYASHCYKSLRTLHCDLVE